MLKIKKNNPFADAHTRKERTTCLVLENKRKGRPEHQHPSMTKITY